MAHASHPVGGSNLIGARVARLAAPMPPTGALTRGVHVARDLGGIAVVDGGALFEAVGVSLIPSGSLAASGPRKLLWARACTARAHIAVNSRCSIRAVGNVCASFATWFNAVLCQAGGHTRQSFELQWLRHLQTHKPSNPDTVGRGWNSRWRWCTTVRPSVAASSSAASRNATATIRLGWACSVTVNSDYRQRARCRRLGYRCEHASERTV